MSNNPIKNKFEAKSINIKNFVIFCLLISNNTKSIETIKKIQMREKRYSIFIGISCKISPRINEIISVFLLLILLIKLTIAATMK